MKSLFSKEKWQQLFYTVSHPSDGFYWIRHGEKGSVAIAILMVVLFGLCFTLNRLLAGFVVNDINERTVNALSEMSGVLMLYLLLCVGNWSITCLMDGEGRLKDIAIAIGYSLLPMIVATSPQPLSASSWRKMRKRSTPSSSSSARRIPSSWR